MMLITGEPRRPAVTPLSESAATIFMRALLWPSCALQPLHSVPASLRLQLTGAECAFSWYA
jgi:hypothetical protein